MAKQYDIIIKLLGIGDSGVGKTCLLCSYTEDSFPTRHGATIGIDFKMKKTIIDGQHVRMQLWDTAGQERFETITKHYFRQAQGIFLVYDITNETSFTNLEKWMSYIKQCAEDNCAVILVGNKVDREELRAVSYEKGKHFALRMKMPFYETSAKDSTNIEEAFLHLARIILQRNKKEYERLKLSRVESEEFEYVSELLRTQDKQSCCFS